MAHLWFMVCTVLGVCCLGVYSSLPISPDADVRLFVTSKGINYANQLVMKNVVNKVQGLKIPPVSMTKSLLWSSVDIRLYNSEVKTVKLGSSSTSFEGGLLKIVLELNEAKLGGNYDFDGGFFLGSGAGTYSVTMHRIQITNNLFIGKDSEGRPLIENRKCQTTIDNTDIQFKGASSFILNLLIKLFRQSVQNDVQKLICKSVTEAINNKTKHLIQKYFGSYESEGLCGQVNFPLVETPDVQTGHIDFLFKGGVNSTCYTPSNSSSNDRGLSDVTLVPSPFKMVTAVVSDRIINQLAELAHYSEKIKWVLDFVQSNGSMSTERVMMFSTHPPFINTTINGTQVTIRAKAIANMSSPYTEKPQRVVINVVITGELLIIQHNKTLFGKVRNFRVKPVLNQTADTSTHKISGGSSILTDWIPTQMNRLLLNLIKAHIVKKLNDRSMEKAAFLAMSEFMTVINPRVLHRQGYLVFDTDVRV